MLDSIPHIKAYRMNIGDELAEIALHYGADDVDGTVGQESIMHLAGAKSSLNYNIYNMAKLITDAGFVPIKRDTTYQNFTTVSVEAPKRIKKTECYTELILWSFKKVNQQRENSNLGKVPLAELHLETATHYF